MRARSIGVCCGVVLMLSGGLASAAEERWTPDQNNCNERPTTYEIADCTAGRTKVWDGRLNQAWKALTAFLASQPQRLTALRAAEQAWIKFRDANCGYYGSQDGTMRQIAAADCMLDMTQSRAIELQGELPQ